MLYVVTTIPPKKYAATAMLVFKMREQHAELSPSPRRLRFAERRLAPMTTMVDCLYKTRVETRNGTSWAAVKP